MKIKEIAPKIEKILINISTDSLTEFSELTKSSVYLCICAVLAVFIKFLDSLSSRFAPIVEILTIALHELEQLKKSSEEFRKASDSDETETVHYRGRYIRAHDVTRSCKNHPNQERAELERLEEENRALRLEIDQSENFQKQKEDEYQTSLEKLEAENKKLQEKLLEMDLQMNSNTSHWPSSMQRYPGGSTYRNGRNKEYDERMEQENKAQDSDKPEDNKDNQKPRRGGRTGHKGYSGRILEDVEPAKVITLYPEIIPKEDRDKYEWNLAGVHYSIGLKFETVVTEYRQMETKIKGDRSPAKNIKGSFPLQAKSETSYDSSFVWLVEVYYTIGLMGMGRIAQIIQSNFGVTMSKSTVNNILKKAGKNLREARDCIANTMKIQGEDPNCVYTADETDLTIGKKKYYDHVLVGNEYALHTISHTRGLDGVFKSGVLEKFEGWLVTDFYGMYKKREWKSAFDRAHLTRELRAAAIRDPECHWIPMMQEFFYQSYKAYYQALETGEPIPEEKLIQLEKQYDEAVDEGLKEEKKMFSKTINLLYRFKDYKQGIIANLYNTEIFLTSNAAERQCKQIKRRMDVSGHFDKLTGAEDYAAALSIIETARLKNMDSIEALQQVLGGNTSYPVTGIADDSISMLTKPVMTTDRSKPKK